MAVRTAAARPLRARRGTSGPGRALRTWPYLAPALIFFFGWQLWPILRVLWISFTDYHFLSNEPAHWIWFHNYAQAFSDPVVLEGLKRAAIFTAVFLPGMIFLPMVIAVLVDRVRNGRVAWVYR